MKLRTEMLAKLGDKFCPICANERSCCEDHEYDAAAAHALMQAIAEYGNPERAYIEQRADELMREWGYTDDS